MDQIVIDKKNGEKMRLFRYDKVSGVRTAEQLWDLSGQDVVNLSVVSAEPLQFDIGDTLDVFGRLYTLNLVPNANKNDDRLFEYELQLEGAQYELIKAQYLDVDVQGVSTGGAFSFMGDVQAFAEMIIRNLDRVHGAGRWSLGVFPTNSEHKNLEFQNETCLAALQKLIDAYATGFDIERIGSANFRLNIRQWDNILPDTFRYGRARGLYELSRMKSSDKNIVSRLFAYGAAKNIPLNYRGGSLRLKMPVGSIFSEGQPYIQDNAALQKYGIVEASINFDEIFPNRTGTVTQINPGNVHQFYDSSMPFNLTESIAGQTTYLIDGMAAKIVFKTGNLAGYEFSLNADSPNSGYVHGERKFTILPYSDDSGNVFPSATEPAFQIMPGDQYTIVDIAMPQSYIDEAEDKLEAVAGQYLQDNSKPHVQYGLTIDANYIQGKEMVPGQIIDYFSAGDYVKVFDADLGIDGKAQIQSLKRNILKHYEYDLTLGDEIPNATARAFRTKRQKLIASAQSSSQISQSAIYQIRMVAASTFQTVSAPVSINLATHTMKIHFGSGVVPEGYTHYELPDGSEVLIPELVGRQIQGMMHLDKIPIDYEADNIVFDPASGILEFSSMLPNFYDGQRLVIMYS